MSLIYLTVGSQFISIITKCITQQLFSFIGNITRNNSAKLRREQWFIKLLIIYVYLFHMCVSSCIGILTLEYFHESLNISYRTDQSTAISEHARTNTHTYTYTAKQGSPKIFLSKNNIARHTAHTKVYRRKHKYSLRYINLRPKALADRRMCTVILSFKVYSTFTASVL